MTKTQDQAAKEADAALKNSRKWRTLRDKEDSPDYGGGTGSDEYFL